MEWQPIETAPKDRSGVLLFTECGIIEAYWYLNRWEQGVISSTYDMSGTQFDCMPTHWMPIPQPPKIKS